MTSLYLSQAPTVLNNRATIPQQLARMDFLCRRDYRENLRLYYGMRWPHQRAGNTGNCSWRGTRRASAIGAVLKGR